MNTLYTSWETVNWTSVQERISKWQNKIYEESKAGNIVVVRGLQRQIVNSFDAKLLATRRVTQDNRGKATAGADGVRRVPARQRLDLAKSLRVPTKAQPVRRVWISKPGGAESRPLGIPTIRDRAMQALVKLALEPEWEARFEPNSYGFRPGRNAHDAVREVLNVLVKGEKYVLDADIGSCFDTIDHDALLDTKICMKGRMRAQIKSWLKAGTLDGTTFNESRSGTPQGGVISPLLANIALHGLENELKAWIITLPEVRNVKGNPLKKSKRAASLHVVRYADDFVVLHPDRNVIIEARAEIQRILAKSGLALSTSKTRLTHTRRLRSDDTPALGFDGNVGFDFLGFTFKQFDSVHHSEKSNRGERLGYRSRVVPSAKSQLKHQRRLHNVVLARGKGLGQSALIQKLNPIVRGWASYFGASDANTAGILAKQDYLLYLKLRQWAKRKTGSAKRAYQKYWPEVEDQPRTFRSGKVTLLTHQSKSNPIRRYVKVKSARSPFDGNERYWAKRRPEAPTQRTRISVLLRRQKGTCAICGLAFTDDDVLEEDHIIPKARGGKDHQKNRQLLHRHCHDEKTRHDGSNEPHESP